LTVYVVYALLNEQVIGGCIEFMAKL